MSAHGSASSTRERQAPAHPESVWPAWLAVLAAIGLQLVLPDRLIAGPRWLLPTLEGLLLVGLIAASPTELEGHHPLRRAASLGLTAFITLTNIASLALLTHLLLHGKVTNGRQLILAGALIWLTNVIIFGLWYWQTDRGGAGRRASGAEQAPDFLFPQMGDGKITPDGWRPSLVDYLYVSFTNATAFSPTDTMPLTATAKSIMALQSLVSLITIGLVVSRAINILGT